MTPAEDKPRANLDGDPCPPWCNTNHRIVGVHLGTGPRPNPPASHRAWSKLYQAPGEIRPTITVMADGGGVVQLGRFAAIGLAELLEGLAETGADLRAVAAEIRADVEVIENGGQI